KGIVLTQITEPQTRMADHLAAVEFFLAEDDPQERALAGAVAADEADVDVVADRCLGAVEEVLVAITFVGVCDLKKHSHRAIPWGEKGIIWAECLSAAITFFLKESPRIPPSAIIVSDLRGAACVLRPGRSITDNHS